MKYFFSSLLIFFFSVNAILGQGALQQQIKKFNSDPTMENGSWSFCVKEIKTGKTLASFDSNRSLIPASSLKTITTATALGILGEDFQFKTYLEYDGFIENGVLQGNLYLRGTGDPTLGSDKMEALLNMEALLMDMVARVKALGINQIQGKVIGDGTYFGSQISGDSWQWNDLGNYYGAGASGLNLHENMYHLYFKQSALNTQPKFEKIEPHFPFLSFTNEVISEGGSDNAYIFGAPYTYHRHIRGSIPPGKGDFIIKGSIPDPPFFAAYQLLTTLESSGVKVVSRIAASYREQLNEGFKKGKLTEIHVYKSPSLKDIVERANMESINLYCESLLRMIGKEKKQSGNPNAGLKAIEDFWQERGVDMDGFNMEDGSGLSPRTTINASQFASILRKAKLDPKIGDSFFNSLPEAGKSGTLKNMFKGTEAVGKLRAKSGSMSRVRSYSGYVTTKSGKEVSFSIIANNFKGSSSAIRKKMEAIMVAIVSL